jgi:hypothetical protein
LSEEAAAESVTHPMNPWSGDTSRFGAFRFESSNEKLITGFNALKFTTLNFLFKINFDGIL